MKLNDGDVSSGHGAGAFRMLVIDNDDADRELTIRHLGEAWPFEHEMVPDHAGTGHEALDKMRATRYALAVLDWRLPGMDGGEVLRIMRRERILTPVMVVSGIPRERIPENLALLGAVFPSKDGMDSVTLRDAIAAALHQLGLGRSLAA
jgi:CheY-like chemotaxis protein